MGDSRPQKTFCVSNVGEVDSRAADTYSTRSEALYYACENTIARYGHEIASFLAERLEASGADVTSSIKEACLQAAVCDGARERKPKQSRTASKESGEKQAK